MTPMTEPACRQVCPVFAHRYRDSPEMPADQPQLAPAPRDPTAPLFPLEILRVIARRLQAAGFLDTLVSLGRANSTAHKIVDNILYERFPITAKSTKLFELLNEEVLRKARDLAAGRQRWTRASRDDPAVKVAQNVQKITHFELVSSPGVISTNHIANLAKSLYPRLLFPQLRTIAFTEDFADSLSRRDIDFDAYDLVKSLALAIPAVHVCIDLPSPATHQSPRNSRAAQGLISALRAVTARHPEERRLLSVTCHHAWKHAVPLAHSDVHNFYCAPRPYRGNPPPKFEKFVDLYNLDEPMEWGTRVGQANDVKRVLSLKGWCCGPPKTEEAAGHIRSTCGEAFKLRTTVNFYRAAETIGRGPWMDHFPSNNTLEDRENQWSKCYPDTEADEWDPKLEALRQHRGSYNFASIRYMHKKESSDHVCVVCGREAAYSPLGAAHEFRWPMGRVKYDRCRDPASVSSTKGLC